MPGHSCVWALDFPQPQMRYPQPMFLIARSDVAFASIVDPIRRALREIDLELPLANARRPLDRGAIGLITTHDLALTAVADQLVPRAVNVHFEDWLEGNDIRFDYRMKPGPVTRSNAIALMRAVGSGRAEFGTTGIARWPGEGQCNQRCSKSVA